MDVPLSKNKNWVGSLHQSIDRLSDALKAEVMKEAGSICASELLPLCEEYAGRKIASIEDLVDGWNKLRHSRGLKGRWRIKEGAVHGIFHECGCPLVRSGLIELHPVQCLCSKGMLETVFAKVARKEVKVQIKRSIGRGDDACEFMVKLDRK